MRNYITRHMKPKIILIILIFSMQLFSAPKTDSLIFKKINAIENEFVKKADNNEKFNDLKERIENEERLNEKTIESISKQLDAASYNLTLFGILFGILAICIGVYVTYVERKIVKIGEENKDLLSKNQKIKSEVEELNELIQKDIYGLFQKIKREETLSILDRLVKIPKDIANVCQVLLSRELLPNDFIKLKQAYDNVKKSNLADQGEEDNQNHYSSQYKILFFQHFLYQAIKVEDLRKDIKDYIYSGIQSAFENDIIKSTTDFTKAILELGIQNFGNETTDYFKGLSASNHRNYLDVYQIFFDNLLSRKNRFEFFNLVNKEETTRMAKIHYGKLLQEAYSKDKPSESENLVYYELNELIDAQNIEEDAIKAQIANDKRLQDEINAAEEEQRRLAEQKT